MRKEEARAKEAAEALGQADAMEAAEEEAKEEHDEEAKVEKQEQEPEKKQDLKDDPPDEYICPISLEIMEDPVIAADGYTYERVEIEAWFMKTRTSPKTNEALLHTHLVPNRNLKNLIKEMCK